MKSFFDSRSCRLRPPWVIGISATLLGLLGMLGAFAPARDFLLHEESWLVLTLNESLEEYQLLDWFVIFWAHPGVLTATMAMLLAAFAIEGWRIRRKDYGRIYGYGFLVLLVTLGFALAVDRLSLRIAPRTAPWLALGGVEDLRQFYTTEFLSMTRLDGFVDGNLVAWSCAMVLLWNRARRLALMVAAFMALHAFSEIALGEQWPLAHLLAVTVGAGVGGVGLWRLEDIFARAEREMESFFVARAWRQLTPSGLGDVRPVAATRSKVVFGRSGREGRLRGDERLWRRLIQRQVLPVISLEAGNYTVTRDPLTPERAPIKRSRYVRFVRTPREETFVVKAAWRWGMSLSPPRRIVRYRLHARNAIALERLQLPVPRVYWVHEGWMSPALRRYIVIVEEYVQGRPLDRNSFDEAVAAMRLLAQLHENKRVGWGPISAEGSASSEEFVWTYIRPRVMYALERCRQQFGTAWPADLSPRIWGWFETAAFRLLGREGIPFRLTHGDVTPDNFLISSGRLKILDLLTMGYEWGGWEAIKATMVFSRKHKDWRGALWQAYFHEAGEGRWREFLRHCGLSAGFFILRELAQGRAFSMRRGRELPPPEQLARRLKRIIQSGPSEWSVRPEATDWEAIGQLFHEPIGAEEPDSGPDSGARVLVLPSVPAPSEVNFL